MKSSNHLPTSLLFTDYTEVSIPFIEFAKATLVPKKTCKVSKWTVGFNPDLF